MSLDNLREKIDETDSEIVRLIARRLELAEEIGYEKTKEGRQVEDRDREQEILEKIKTLAQTKKIDPQDIESIYQQIFSAAKRIQGIEVAFQGEIGAYSEEAAFQFFGASVGTRPCETVDEVFQLTQQNKVQYGVVPVENSLEGSISRVYDLMLDSSLKVSGEIELRVVHSLIANPGVKLEQIKKIYSHPQALGQCQGFLKHLKSELVPTYDTAGSVKMIKEKGIRDGAAVAGARAAKIYDMEIIATEIEDNQNNFTRFFILSKQEAAPTGNDKTSIVFSVKHRPGALFEFLQELAQKGINLTKIESRPTRRKAWEYNFYLDFEGHQEDKLTGEVLTKLERNCLFLKILGSYPKARSAMV